MIRLLRIVRLSNKFRQPRGQFRGRVESGQIDVRVGVYSAATLPEYDSPSLYMTV